MSLALGTLGIPHRLVASDSAVNEIVKAHRLVLGKIWFDPSAPTVCSSVDTMIRRDPRLFAHIGQWVTDEAHHLLRENKWGQAVAMMPNARGLGVTATPERSDGKGLGRKWDGVFDEIIQGPSGRDLIDLGYLSDFQYVCTKPDDLILPDDSGLGANGEFKQNLLRTATKASRKLIGGIVKQYTTRAYGKLGITFCVDIEEANRTAQEFEDAKIPVAVVTAKNTLLERSAILEKYRRREIWQLVNVDLFGEGFDVPGVEVVQMGRYTNSYGLFSQQIGRCLRPVYAKGYDLSTIEGRKAAIVAGGKTALVIDHVENLLRHRQLPTAARPASLAAKEKRGRGTKMDDADKLRVCSHEDCGLAYLAFLDSCPYCKREPARIARSTNIQEIEGDLVLLDSEMLAKMDREASRIMQPVVIPQHLPRDAAMSLMRKHNNRTSAQQKLRDVIALWGGYRTAEGLSVREAQRKFYLTFGTDVLTAQALSTNDADALRETIEGKMT